MPELRVVLREDKAWEQIVFAEVLVPNVVNNFGDIYTPDAIVEFAHTFAQKGYGLDVNHDQVDVSGTKYHVVESFIARPGDPDFIEGSWVVGVKVTDPELWDQILGGEINGFSFEALVSMVPVSYEAVEGREVVGTTSPDPTDGHTHSFLVVLDSLNNPISGGTSENSGHSHRIVSHTVTEVAEGHNHRYQVMADNGE